MKKILVFGGSNSKKSINKKLAVYASSLMENAQANILDLNDFELPMYGIDLENEKGIPENASLFLNLIKDSDGVIMSLAENNGAYTAVFKNLFDWISRIESKTFFGKPILLMATAPGARGGISVLEMAQARFPYHDAHIAATFSLPFFNDNFSEDKITDFEFNLKLKDAVQLFEKEL
ncbi:NADPH-dependent FMN reductase [Mariniflexile ostreae]|uniref:NADPH-dependent FMN reductase n=1 Tax=Mariniflexile ostreae TaxID=1520892 RepID=A0ABV5F949_9FLAO